MAKIKGGRSKYTCANWGCQFSTNHPHRMEHHKRMTGHGKETRARKYSAYHLAGGKNKKKAA